MPPEPRPLGSACDRPVARLTRDDICTATQVAEIFGLAKSTVYDLANRGEIPGAFRLGRRLLFSMRALDAWVP